MVTETYEFTREQIDYMTLAMITHINTVPTVEDSDVEMVTGIVDRFAEAQNRPELSAMSQIIRDTWL